MLSERDRRAWTDIERRLGRDAASRFVSFRLLPARRAESPPWVPYLMAVVVPLSLPALSAMEMRPLAAGIVALIAAAVVLPHWLGRGAGGSGRRGRGSVIWRG